ncbi:MAG: hypothetical protein H7Y89_13245 [Steroidobacteraceae bacterium]|nr:hypothetical protein [Steroidobacteraceae bacterium]
MNLRWLAALSISGAACWSVGTSAFAQEPTAAELVVIDLRPKEERDGNGLAALDGKCNKDVFRIADVASDPLKVDVLKAELTRQLIDGGGGKTLAVLNWSIYYNKQVQGGGGGLNGVGVGGYSIPTGKKKEGRRPGSDCSRRESGGGWYEGNELTTQYFPLISEFMGTFAGKPLNVRIVHSPTRKLEGKFEGSPNDTEALGAAIQSTIDAISMALVQ